MAKTIAEINDKIKSGQVVVITAEEAVDLVREKGPAQAAAEVDVVTTGTFSPMCSSGAMINVKQAIPRMKFGGGRAWFNGVPAYTGLAAADLYLGCNALPDDAPRNRVHPGLFNYGGAHVICELVGGKKVLLRANGYGTDCYPMREREQWVGLEDFNDAVLWNPRNCYQNYNVAVNLSDDPVYTYMGTLQPRLGNANFCSAGRLSLCSRTPQLRTIGLGTRIFLAGAVGYVVWPGTQHQPDVPPDRQRRPPPPGGHPGHDGRPEGDVSEWLRPLSMTGYGGDHVHRRGYTHPHPGRGDDDPGRDRRGRAPGPPVVDYSTDYPQGTGGFWPR